jgi:hypothetical protein
MSKFSTVSPLSGRIRLAAACIATTLLFSCASAPPASPGLGQLFTSPEQATSALVAAARTDNRAELVKILGPESDRLVNSGDPVADARGRAKFIAAYDESHRIEKQNDNREVLVIGSKGWPMPIPLVRTSGGWQFDAAAGTQEILDRRIGNNEMTVIRVCGEYVDAQMDYAAEHKVRRGGSEYAQHFISHKGHDGLYWPIKAGAKESPLGPLIAEAAAEGYDVGKKQHASRHERKPFFGYYYRILKSQGPNAAGGAMDYVTKGRMTKGFALIAWPAKYGDSGVMSFIVNANGIVYQKNLGSDTAALASQISRFDPDPSWNIAE